MERNKIIRYDNLDLMKFIAISFVLMYHLMIAPIDIMNDHNMISYLNYIISGIFSTCVPIFFLVNGFLLIKKELNLKKHLIKTFKLIFITVIWGVITLISFSVITGEYLSVYEFLDSLWNRKHGLNHLWFMGALVCIYLIFPIIKVSFDTNKKIFNYFVLLTIVLTFGNSLLCMITTVSDHIILNTSSYVYRNYFNMFNPLRGLVVNTFAYFCIGCYIASSDIIDKIYGLKFVNKVSVSAMLFISTMLHSLWGIVSSHIINSTWDLVWFGYDSIFTLINVILIYMLCRDYKYNDKNIICRFIRLISQNTLGIYFIHIIFNVIISELGIKNIVALQNHFFNVVIAYLIMLFSLASVLLIKKIPFIRNLV